MVSSRGENNAELFRWSDQIPSPLWEDLLARPANQAADAVGAKYENGKFIVPMIGIDYQVDPQCRGIVMQGFSNRVSYQEGVVLLTTLANSKGVPPSGRMVMPQELTGGALFFTGAHSIATKPLAKRFGNEPDALIAKAMQIGGTQISGADCAVRLLGLPFVPLYVLFWKADEEFEARAAIGIDDRALFHLDLSGVLGLTNTMVSRLVR